MLFFGFGGGEKDTKMATSPLVKLFRRYDTSSTMPPHRGQLFIRTILEEGDKFVTVELMRVRIRRRYLAAA
mgnify:CR=1 FL=1